MEAFPLSLDHNKYTSIGLSEHKEVPTYAQVNYMGFSKFFPTQMLRNRDPEIVLKFGDTIECNGWKLKLNNQADLFQAIENLKTEYVVVNPTAGAHCGPNCVGVAFHANHR